MNQQLRFIVEHIFYTLKPHLLLGNCKTIKVLQIKEALDLVYDDP